MQKKMSLWFLCVLVFAYTAHSAPVPKPVVQEEMDFPTYLLKHGIEHALEDRTRQSKDFQKIYNRFIGQCPNCETKVITESREVVFKRLRSALSVARRTMQPVPQFLYRQLSFYPKDYYVSIQALKFFLKTLEEEELSEFLEFTDFQLESLVKKKPTNSVSLRKLIIAYEGAALFGTHHPQKKKFSKHLEKWNSLLQRVENLGQWRKDELKMTLKRFQRDTKTEESRRKAIELDERKQKVLLEYFRERPKYVP